MDNLKSPEWAASACDVQPTGKLLINYMAALHPIEPQEAKMRLDVPGVDYDWSTVKNYLPLPYIIDLAGMTSEMAAYATSYGLSVAILTAVCEDRIGFAAKNSLTLPMTPEEAEAEGAIRQESKLFGFQNYFHPFFQAGGLVCIDPFTGRRLVSTHSFVFESLHIAYRFSGLETFYVIIGGIGSVVRFCCIPRLNCLILADVSGENDKHKQWSQNLHRQLMINVLQYGSELNHIFQKLRPATAVALGSWPNLGHFIWQELAGLDEILQLHGSQAIQHVLLGPHTHLPIAELFPEIADRITDNYSRVLT